MSVRLVRGRQRVPTSLGVRRKQETNGCLVTGLLIARERRPERQIAIRNGDSVVRLHDDALRVARPSVKLRLDEERQQRCQLFADPSPDGVHVQQTYQNSGEEPATMLQVQDKGKHVHASGISRRRA